jgi:xylulokinase
VKKAKLKPADVKAIGLSGQMHGSVFPRQKRQGRPQGAALERPADRAECEEIERRAGGRKKLIEWSPTRR